jgi:dTDP-4-dehydrorhamnose reductase
MTLRKDPMNPKRVMVTGANGQLGTAIKAVAPSGWLVYGLSSSDLDVRDWNATRERLRDAAPELVIHAAAATNVDRCEREPEWAFEVNALGTRNVARAAAEVGAQMVYVSTNYVFNGTKTNPYHEFDEPDPISVYGASKLAGEAEALHASERCFVVRTASVYAEYGVNFVATMRRLMSSQARITVVDDQFSNPTYAPDLATAIFKIVERGPYGVYHATNTGIASWHEWASEIKRIDAAQTAVVAIPASEYRRDASPPSNGAMTSLALPGIGVSLPDWRDALKRCIATWPE